MTDLAELRMQVHPGGGLVAHFGSATVLVPDDARGVLVTSVMDTVETASGGTGRRLIRKLAALLADADPDDGASFAVLAADTNGLAVMLYGSVDLRIEEPGGAVETLSGRDVATWVDRLIRTPFERLVLTPSGDAEPPLNPRADLRAGTVEGRGITVTAREGQASSAPVDSLPSGDMADPAGQDKLAVVVDQEPPTREQSATLEPAQPSDGRQADETPAEQAPEFVSLDLSPLPEEELSPLPVADGGVPPMADDQVMIKGIYCSRGHFDDPRARFCVVCGISMVHKTHNLILGPRPPLGLLLLDDGASFTLDGDYVIGREPESDPEVQAGQARPLVLEDEARKISRVHAKVSLRDWDVRIEDVRSTNGTSILRPGTDQWAALPWEEPTTIVPGTRVKVGGREILFDSHHSG